MNKIIKGWKHIPGLHCGSVALRDVSSYFGFEFSEDMCFGLGSGLGFYYIVDKGMSPTHAIHVRGPGMEQKFFKRFGMDVKGWKQEEDPQKAQELLKYYIDRDIPVLIQTDIYYLDYYNSSTHFPGHIVVVWGYDDETQRFYVSDTGFEGLRVVSYESMQKARSSTARPYPLRYNWFEVDLRGREIDLEKASKEAIIENAMLMLKGVETNRGLSGVSQIKSWAEDFKNWYEVQDRSWCCRYAYQVISKRGTEGAAFRHMYRGFLKEVLDLVSQVQQLGLVEIMDEIGNCWVELSMRLKELSEIEDPSQKYFIEIIPYILRVYDMEYDFYSSVIKGFKRN